MNMDKENLIQCGFKNLFYYVDGNNQYRIF